MAGVRKSAASARAPAQRRASTLPTIAAVGASAGGLEAFIELLAALPGNLPAAPGLALVFLQQQPPGCTSLLPQQLQRATAMKVEEARDGVRPQARHLYVLPPGMMMTLEHGRLRLGRRGPQDTDLPIDHFMRSLAQQRKHAAMGVVLAGSASDGTRGLEAIKAEGGICYAQSEDSTEFSGMPRHAAASGAVDYVLPPADIGRELGRIGSHAYLAAAEPALEGEGLISVRGRAYAAIVELLRAETGVDFAEYRSSTISRRIARRMALHLLDTAEEYLRYLRGHPAEVTQLGEDILIPTTRFFREPQLFAMLQQKVLRPLAAQRRAQGQPIRLWSVGCSTGQEAYSLAMVALESLGGMDGRGARVQVFGTDLNESAVRRARQGLYPADIAGEVPAERLQRFFVKTERGYRVSRALREACIFARHNVVSEAPFSRLDIICCRNVMIYMEPCLQRRLLQVLHYAVQPEGMLVLGSAESTGATPKLFRPLSRVDRQLKIYTKLGNSTPAHFSLVRPGPAAGRSAAVTASHAGEDAHQEADRLTLRQFAPAGVIVDGNLEVVEFRGQTSDFLEPASGAASLNLSKLARGDIGAYTRSAVLQARRTGEPVKIEGVVTERAPGGGGSEVELIVTPLTARAGGSQGLFLVLFHPTAPLPAAEGRGQPAPAAQGRELERLRRDLTASRRLLATLSVEHQASRQEYQAANEEIASANGELQRANEELETSKEELQSANEELNTFNEELRHSNAEQHQLSDDLQNLIHSVSMALVLLDRDLRVRRYSTVAERVLRLVPADIGRRVNEIRWGIPNPDLEPTVVAALATGDVQTRVVQDSEGHWYELRVHPCPGADRKVEGAVMMLTGIDGRGRH